MARFELDDGTLRKFWEIELNGPTLQFRYGELGTSGRTRSKRLRSEQAARLAHEEAVRVMAAQGYVRQFMTQAPVPVEGPVWSALEADPDDRELLAVHADWLQSEEDPRGELLATQLAAETATGDRRVHLLQRVAELQATFMDVDFPGEHRVEWGLGYLKRAVFSPEGGRGSDPAAAASSLLGGASYRLLRELSLRVPCAVRILLSGSFPALRTLSLQAYTSHLDGHQDIPLNLDRLASVAPRLQSLQVRGPVVLAGEAALRNLTALDLRWSPSCQERLAGRQLPPTFGVQGVDLPAMQALDFRGVETLHLAPAWGSPVAAMLDGLRGVGIQALRLESVEVDLGMAVALARLGLQSLSVGAAVDAEALAYLDAQGLHPEGAWKLSVSEDVEDDPDRPKDLEMRRYEVRSPRGEWFWEIGVHRAVHHVRYGRIGKSGRWVWRRFPSEDVAQEIAQRRIEEKLREGYSAHETGLVSTTP